MLQKIRIKCLLPRKHPLSTNRVLESCWQDRWRGCHGWLLGADTTSTRSPCLGRSLHASPLCQPELTISFDMKTVFTSLFCLFVCLFSKLKPSLSFQPISYKAFSLSLALVKLPQQILLLSLSCAIYHPPCSLPMPTHTPLWALNKGLGHAPFPFSILSSSVWTNNLP